MKYAAFIQGIIYLLAGIWPVIHMKSFEIVTGPKVDHWLVRTVGLLIFLCGLMLVGSWWRESIPWQVAFTGIGFAVVLTLIDLYYVLKKRISKVYLLDALLQCSLILAWIIAVQF
jgi:hypothetical protein